MKVIGCFGLYRNKQIKFKAKKQDIINGILKIKCIECSGTGIFYIPDGEIGVMYSKDNPAPLKATRCVVCKGKGFTYIDC